MGTDCGNQREENDVRRIQARRFVEVRGTARHGAALRGMARQQTAERGRLWQLAPTRFRRNPAPPLGHVAGYAGRR